MAIVTKLQPSSPAFFCTCFKLYSPNHTLKAQISVHERHYAGIMGIVEHGSRGELKQRLCVNDSSFGSCVVVEEDGPGLSQSPCQSPCRSESELHQSTIIDHRSSLSDVDVDSSFWQLGGYRSMFSERSEEDWRAWSHTAGGVSLLIRQSLCVIAQSDSSRLLCALAPCAQCPLPAVSRWPSFFDMQ